jgi:PAS domain S-box-containing protein
MSDAILVVADEDHFYQSLKQILCAAGYNVDTATSSRKAHACILNNEYAAALLDLHLPVLDSIEIDKCFNKHLPNCSIIILTEDATLTSAMEAVRLSCYEYISKPCRPEQVLHTLDRLMETRKLKIQLLASNAKYQMLTEATREAITIFSETCIFEVNQQFCELFEVDEDKALTQSFNDFVPELVISNQATSIDSRKLLPAVEVEAIRSNGNIFPAEVRLKQSFDTGNLLWTAAIRDLSRERQEALARIKLEEKLAYAMRMESIGLMAGSVAHDLNNILSSIVTFPDLLLLEMPADASYRKDIQRIKQAGQKAAEVVADLLTVARGSTCQKKIGNINNIVVEYQESLDYLSHTRNHPQITVDITTDPLLEDTRISAIHILKSLLNLVRNAVEAIDKSGAIKIYTAHRVLQETLQGYEVIPPGQYAVLGVADNGKGIAEQHIFKIFQPFYTKKQLGMSGTGLGLTVIMHTVRDHSGYIDLHSGAEGTVFELYFPTCQGKNKTLDGTVNLDSLLGKGEKVLIIDDEENQRLLISSILKRLGYTPCVAENGEQAIRYLKEEVVDLLLLDLIMEPGMSGYQTFKEIRRFVPNQRAVVTSGYHTHPDREKIRALGVSRYLAKPLSVTHLALALQQEIKA